MIDPAEFSDVEKNTVDDFINRDASEDFKVIGTRSFIQKEIGSLSLNTCEETDGKGFQCWICNHRCKRSPDLSRHVKEVHLKYRPYHCGICGYRTYRTYTLRVHLLTVHKGIKNHCCHFNQSSNIGSEAPQNMDYYYHQDPQYVSTYSNKNTKLKDRVMKANKIEKTFFCSFCHLKTKWESSLRNHINAVHLKAKPHKCPICKYKASSRYNITRHVKTVHMKDKPHYLCPKCPYKATRSDTLKVHVKRLHPEKVLTIGSCL